MRDTRTTRALIALGSAAALLLSACGSTGEEANDADIAFASQMIPHHRQAVVMAEMVDDKEVSAELSDLADRVEAAQEPEIETMRGWLDDWDADGGMAGMDHGDMDHGDMDHGDMDDMGDMPGMMGPGDMRTLAEAEGEQFERLWLQLMIQHHEGAVEMAETEIEDGSADDAVALARDIASAQQEEIDEMRAMLEE